jgi:MFS family permease
MPTSEPAVVTAEVAERSLAGAGVGLVIGAVIGLVIAALLFGLPGGDQSSRDTTMFWVCLAVGAVAGVVPGFVFGGGRGVRDARRQAEAEARGGR